MSIDKQAAFDKVWRHFAARQFERCTYTCDGGDRCSYLRDDGHRCAVGALVSEADAALLERRAVIIGARAYQMDGIYDRNGWDGEDIRFLSVLQNAHDLDAKGHTYGLQGALRDFAQRYGLQVPA